MPQVMLAAIIFAGAGQLFMGSCIYTNKEQRLPRNFTLPGKVSTPS
jgi:hypothetical protein